MRKINLFKIILLPFVCLAVPLTAVSQVYSNAATSLILEKRAFDDYIATCKAELDFDTIPQFTCKDINFRPPTDQPQFANTNDFVAHRKVNSFVDSVFICRWIQNTNRQTTSSFALVDDVIAATGEMIVHNRLNGKTCFFQMKPVNKTLQVNGAVAFNTPFVPTINPPSPTDISASQFWDSPKETQKIPCAICHSAGPYIASPQIAPALARYGLMNDGHDVKGEKYTAVGSLGTTFNNYIAKTLDPSQTCSTACHVTGGNKAVFDSESFVQRDVSFNILMPSLNSVIDEIFSAHHMPPNDPFSEYRWINRDVPRDSGDHERLSDVKRDFLGIYESCKTPEYMQAHESDNTLMMATNDFVDVIDTFNLHDGLVCLNAKQTGGRCNNYETRYRCNGKWTTWQSHDSPASTGDHEKRSSFSFPSTCTAPYAIQARYYVGDEAHIVNGPPDRLSQFNSNGLICLNADQPEGEKCHDYTVRFICP